MNSEFQSSENAKSKGYEGNLFLSAHRGICNGETNQENTLESIRAVLGNANLKSPVCHWIELDLRKSSDGQIYLFHDDAVEDSEKRLIPCSSLSIEELRELSQRKIPLLSEALQLLSGSSVGIHCDLKEDVDAEEVLGLLEETVGISQALFSGSNISILIDFHSALLSRGKRELTSIGLTTPDPFRVSGNLRDIDIAAQSDFFDFLCIPIRKLNSEIIRLCRERHLELSVWRKDLPEDAQSARELSRFLKEMEDAGQDLLLVTDNVAKDRDVLKRYESSLKNSWN